jgi:hypothetical protein
MEYSGTPCTLPTHGWFSETLTADRALASGPKRDHFLAVATPENVASMKGSDPTVFERADYGRSYSTTSSYAPSAVWTWLVHREEEPKMLGYSDV